MESLTLLLGDRTGLTIIQRADGSLQFKAAFVPVAGDAKETPEGICAEVCRFVKVLTRSLSFTVLITVKIFLPYAADWHHGKQVWGKEISGGGENWDIHESRSEFENYVAYAKMRVAPYKPDTIVLELLGDWFNVDSPSNTQCPVRCSLRTAGSSRRRHMPRRCWLTR